MKKTDLISKWLNFNLSDNELEAFNDLDASGSYRKISETARHFKSADFNTSESYKTLHAKLYHKRPKSSWKRYISAVAAILVVCFGILYFLNTASVEYVAANSLKTEFTLPDTSEVTLNAGSTISFNEKNWEDNRSMKLKGEAYFKVAKGKKFTVQTDQGLVTVLGTQFTVNARDGYFEVRCFEGLVQVDHKNESIKIPAGNSYKAFGSNIIKETIAEDKPSWLNNKSSFKSIPFNQVVAELERQYNINISGDASSSGTLFTGSFSHENVDTALQAITIPLNLSYIINGKNVVFKNNQQ